MFLGTQYSLFCQNKDPKEQRTYEEEKMNQLIYTITSFLILGCGNFSRAHADTPENNIPKPIFLQEKTTKNTEGIFDIVRIAGCHGEQEKAKKNIVPATGILKEPIFHNEKWIPSIFTVPTLQEPTCILDDDPMGVQEYYAELISYEAFLMQDYECGCAECWDDKGQPIDEETIIAAATEKDKKAYAEYSKKRNKEITIAKEQHQQYKAEYENWIQLRQEKMSPQAVRITISPKKDIPAGQLSIYNFSWYITSWCGDTDNAERQNLIAKQFSHPPISAGTSLHIWLDGANSDLSWGVVMHPKEELIANDIQSINESSRKIMEQNTEREYQNRIPLKKIPDSLKNHAYETPDARLNTIFDECCAC